MSGRLWAIKNQLSCHFLKLVGTNKHLSMFFRMESSRETCFGARERFSDEILRFLWPLVSCMYGEKSSVFYLVSEEIEWLLVCSWICSWCLNHILKIAGYIHKSLTKLHKYWSSISMELSEFVEFFILSILIKKSCKMLVFFWKYSQSIVKNIKRNTEKVFS